MRHVLSASIKKGPWTRKEDELLSSYIAREGEGKCQNLPKKAGLLYCEKSCSLRWMNYLRLFVKRGGTIDAWTHSIDLMEKLKFSRNIDNTEFLDNKDDIPKLRECFVILWHQDDTEAIKNAVEQPEAYVMKS
nr:transcription repressor MYB5-like [Tanacetum cinerariifolium]